MKSEKSSLKKGKRPVSGTKQKKGSYPKYIKNHHSQEKKTQLKQKNLQETQTS